ncbi:MAG: hypothetical protein P1U63_12000 [Coxiellaceae bacterium]|nr:hypothetical protein [Coxiellaceae bacterium]
MRDPLDVINKAHRDIAVMRGTIARENLELVGFVNQVLSALNQLLDNGGANPKAAIQLFNLLRSTVAPSMAASDSPQMTAAQASTLREALQELTFDTELDPSAHIDEDGIPAAPAVAPPLRRQ